MWKFDETDYCRRVLGPACDAFLSGKGPPDIFARYDLPLDIGSSKADTDEIESALRTVEIFWNRVKTEPKYTSLLSVLSNTKELETCRKTLTDPRSRLEASSRIRKARKAVIEARLADLDNSVAMLAGKGFITAAERTELLRHYSSADLTEKAITDRITVPVREGERAARISIDEGLERHVRDEIRRNLSVLNFGDLYEFLGLHSTPSPDRAQLQKAYDASIRKWAKAGFDAKKTSANTLNALIKLYLIEGDPANYAAARRWDVIEALRPDVMFAATDGIIDQSEFDGLRKLAISKGIPEAEAADLIQALVTDPRLKAVPQFSPNVSSATPKIEIDKDTFEFLDMTIGSHSSGLFKVSNVLGGRLAGTIESNRSWLVSTAKQLDEDRHIQDIEFAVHTSRLKPGFEDDGRLVVRSNGGTVTIRVRLRMQADVHAVLEKGVRLGVWGGVFGLVFGAMVGVGVLGEIASSGMILLRALSTVSLAAALTMRYGLSFARQLGIVCTGWLLCYLVTLWIPQLRPLECGALIGALLFALALTMAGVELRASLRGQDFPSRYALSATMGLILVTLLIKSAPNAWSINSAPAHRSVQESPRPVVLSTARVIGASTLVRNTPSREGLVNRRLETGDRVYLKSSDGPWYLISSHPGGFPELGWVHGSLLQSSSSGQQLATEVPRDSRRKGSDSPPVSSNSDFGGDPPMKMSSGSPQGASNVSSVRQAEPKSTEALFNVSVPSTSGFVSAGFSVIAGDKIVVSSSGAVSWLEGAPSVGPDGTNADPSISGHDPSQLLAPNAPCGALILRIGNGTWTFVGQSREVTVRGVGGEVSLAINDQRSSVDDNFGSFQVNLKRQRRERNAAEVGP